MNRPLSNLFLIFLFLVGCNDKKTTDATADKMDSTPLFTLLSSEKTGIGFSNDLEEDVFDETKNILSFDHFFNGGGVAIGDINNDGLEDIFFTGNEVENRLYLNKGNMVFEDITGRAGINVGKKWSTGVTMADVNGDGYLDIYVCQAGPSFKPWADKANLLYINQGNETFVESAKAYGLDDTNISTMASFFDYDKDGDLDCFVMNESKYTLVAHAAIFEDLKKKENLLRASCNLYRNDNGKFVNVTEKAGMLGWSFGLGLVTSDFNNDGWPDVYVANDYSVPDVMYINNGDGTFTDRIKEKTGQISFYSMGIDVADVNNDGFQEIGVVDMAIADHFRSKTLMASMDTDIFWYYINTLNYQYQYMFNVFQLNNGNGTYSNIANTAGLSKTDWSWAALLMDLDNDGFKDYYVTNGFRRYARDNDFRNEMQRVRDANGGTIPRHMREEMYDKMPTMKLSNQAYHNSGELVFNDKTVEWGLDHPSFSNGAAYADLDNDGDLDLVVNNIAEKAFVYQNNAREINGNHFLNISLKAKSPKTSIANTFVTIHYGDEMQYLEYMNTRGFQSSVGNTLHFGLEKVEKIDRLEVTWPDGSWQVIENIPVDQKITLEQSNATNAKKPAQEKPQAQLAELNPADLGINFVHQENHYNDFQKQILLPHKQSTLGPFISVADANGDGLDDFFVGGASGQRGTLYFQKQDGTFYEAPDQPWVLDIDSEDMDALFYDADNDGDPDLYIVSGGGADFEANSPLLQDRIYINTGKGKYQKAMGSLPEMLASGSRAKAADFDGDGDLDIFVGGRAVPGKYPYASRSYLLAFDKFKYKDVTAEVAPDLVNPGIVTDFLWTDFNADGLQDLIVVGEWMAVSFYQNEGGKFKNVTETTGTQDLKGWWYSIKEADIDQDGDMDYICGNLGTNNKFQPSHKKPFSVFAEDFDGNGTCDVVLSKEYKGKSVPLRGRQCSSQQMPFIAEKFPTFKEFANADLNQILGEDKLKQSLNLEVTGFESIILVNDGKGHFEAKQLPVHAQLAPINGILLEDFDKDGIADILIAGNMYHTEVETARYDAGTGLVLKGNGKGDFIPMSIAQSGFYAPGDVKDVKIIRRANGKKMILVSNNNGPLQVFQASQELQ